MTIHVSTVGTYHPQELNGGGWSINDTRGYLDAGPSCSECGRCECAICPVIEGDMSEYAREYARDYHAGSDSPHKVCYHGDGVSCVGLSFAYVNMDDGAESLCEDCATKAGIKIIPCDCP